MVTVAQISKQAFDAVAGSITDAVHAGTLNDGTSTFDGRVVFGGDTAPGGFPMGTAKDKTRPAYLEGFSQAAAIGDELTAAGKVHHVLGVRDIVEAGGLIVAKVIAADEVTWLSADIMRKTNVSDGAGGFTSTTATLATVTAGMIALSGSERWAADRVEAKSKWRMWFKSDVEIKATDYVQVAGRKHNISFVNDVERRGIWTVLDLDLGVAT